MQVHPGIKGRADEMAALARSVRRLIDVTVLNRASPVELAACTRQLDEVASRLEAHVPDPAPFVTDPSLRGAMDSAAAMAGRMPFDVVIGPYSPLALPVEIEFDPPRARGWATFTAAYEGPPGCVHGAVITATFDIVLTAANIVRGDAWTDGRATDDIPAPDSSERSDEVRSRGRRTRRTSHPSARASGPARGGHRGGRRHLHRHKGLDHMTPHPWADFGGTCLLGEVQPAPELLLPESTVFGIPKAASYLYGTWRDAGGRMYRALRGVEAHSSDFAFLFAANGDTQLAGLDIPLFKGPTVIVRGGSSVTFDAHEPHAGPDFRFEHLPDRCSWIEGDHLEMSGRLLGPGESWYHPWPEGGGCYTASLKYASDGNFRGLEVSGFIGHEIHYMPEGRNWFNTRYGMGMEICWHQIANEYDDGSFVHGTFAYGTEGWGFAMLHDEEGRFHATTDVEIDAVIRPNGYPERVTYSFPNDRWTWRIDKYGERGVTIAGAPLGADGTCTRDGDPRRVLRSLGNSDWWTDGRYEASRATRAHLG